MATEAVATGEKRTEAKATEARADRADLRVVLQNAISQFQGLNPREPGQWPLLPRIATWLLAAAAMLGLGWWGLLSGAQDELEAERNKEPVLKADYRSKLAQAVNLNELRKQKLQVEEYVTQLEKQLPGKAEMDALLSDINQAGLGRGLQFELFRPGQVVVKDYYAELPIAIRVAGRYHDLGAFVADIANLSRIVTLHNLSIVGLRDPAALASGTLAMDATARTYRYLDTTEIEEVKRATAARNKVGPKK
jgi:type IV pilus assembly protein PilO